MSDATETGPVLAADGRPLKQSLNRALRMQKLRALALIAPLLIFIVVTFIAPIADMLFRSVENQIVSDTLPRTVAALEDWNPDTGEAPDEEVFQALFTDFYVAKELKIHTRLGSRLNYETVGLSSLFRKSGRAVDRMGDFYGDQFEDLDRDWTQEDTWVALMASPAYGQAAESWIAEQKAARADGQSFNKAPPAFELAPGASPICSRAPPKPIRCLQISCAAKKKRRRWTTIHGHWSIPRFTAT